MANDRSMAYRADPQFCDVRKCSVASYDASGLLRHALFAPTDVVTLSSLSKRTIFVKGSIMLSWALTFLIIALVAAALGFGGVAGTAAWAAKVLFVVFLILFVVSLIAGRPVRDPLP